MPAETHSADVAVIGAGLAGLYAARAVVAAGRSVVVLEARDRVGGRTENYPVSEGHSLDVGGSWTGPGQARLMALADDLGIERFRPQTVGTNIFFDGETRILAEAKSHRDYSGVVAPGELEAAVERIDGLGAELDPAAPWAHPRAAEWDAQTAETWLLANVSRDAKLLLDHVIEGYLSVPGEVSFLHMLFYTATNGGVAGLLGLHGPAHDHEVFRGGAQLIAIGMAAALGDAVRLGTRVRRLAVDDTGVTLSCEDAEVRAKRAIVAIPPVLAGRLEYAPALPPLRDHLTARFPIRSKIKAHALYDEPFWRADGLTGSATSERMITLDTSPPAGRPGVMSCLVGIVESRRLWTLPEADRRAAILAEYARAFGPRALRPELYVERYWAAEEFSRGCVSVAVPGAWTAYGSAMRAPVGRIHWAGAETATEFPGNMEGALQSGERAAREVLAVLA